MREGKFDVNLPCKLTEEEELLKGQEMAAALVEVRKLEEKKAAEASNMKAQIDAAKLTLATLGGIVRTRTEFRNVECEETRDERQMLIIRTRLDTGEIIDSRPMTEDERQPKLFAIGGKPAKKSEAS